MPPNAHALLSASGSYRWLNCTAAPHFEAQFPEEEASVYMKEGTLAHRFCEEMANYNFHLITKRSFSSRWKKLQADPLYQEEMEKTAEFYGHYLWTKSLAFESKPYTVQEVRVDLTDWVPKGFGTCDSVMIGSGRLHITDYKHGKGVEVSAVNNSQMRLYALGALKKYMPVYGDSIQTVSMAIVQPRITEDISEEEITVSELLAWGEHIKPIAEEAYYTEGKFNPGSWCRFCKGKHLCRARSENMTALEDFKGLEIEGKMTEQEKIAHDTQKLITGSAPAILSDAEVGELITRGEGLIAWYEDLKAYALQAILAGQAIPGYRVVAGKSNRAFTDADKALETIKNAGYDDTMLYERKVKSLSELEKMIGKKDFAELVGALITKPVGKPTLVKADDKRPDYSSAEADFKGVVT